MKSKLLIGVITLALTATLFVGCGAKEASEESKTNLERSLEVDVTTLKSVDGQYLIDGNDTIKNVPARPNNPDALPEDDSNHWYDYEYAGWNVQKAEQPKSPTDGAIGKKVILVEWGTHPYFDAYMTGMKKIADEYEMDFKTLPGDWTVETQEKQIDVAIAEKPDMIIVIPADAKKSLAGIKKIYDAKIPVIASNLLPSDEILKYTLAYTGPDDWGSVRKIAKAFAQKAGSKGGYAIIRHKEGGGNYYARTYALVTELKKIAPEMKLLDAKTGELTEETSKKVTEEWIQAFGKELTAIYAANDSKEVKGASEALKASNRSDVVIMASGHSKEGIDFLKQGTLTAVTYQSAESDGATPMKLAADWLNGKEIPVMKYLPILDPITKETVSAFEPAQW